MVRNGAANTHVQRGGAEARAYSAASGGSLRWRRRLPLLLPPLSRLLLLWLLEVGLDAAPDARLIGCAREGVLLHGLASICEHFLRAQLGHSRAVSYSAHMRPRSADAGGALTWRDGSGSLQ